MAPMAAAEGSYDVLIEQYESRAAMTNSTTSASMIYILGYTNPGDGGDGLYTRLDPNITPGWVGGVKQQDGQWWELIVPATGLDPRAVRVTFNGNDPDTVAWNSLIDAINAGKVLRLVLPPLTSLINNTLTPITASNWSIHGTDGTSIQMTSDAPIFGPYLQIGGSDPNDANGTASYWTIDHLYFENLNFRKTDPAPTVAPVLDIRNAKRGYVSYVRTDHAGGFCKLGDSVNKTAAGGIQFYGCAAVDWSEPDAVIAIDVQSQAGTKFTNCSFGAGGIAKASFRGMKIHPLSTDSADTMKCVNCEWNYSGSNPKFNFEVDATNTSIGTQIFVGCVIDQAVAASDGAGANIYVHIDGGAPGNAHFDATFLGCTSNGSTNADCMLLDNSGDGTINISWVGGSLSQLGSSGHLAHVESGHIDLTISSAALKSRSPDHYADSAILIEDGCSGVHIHHNRALVENSNTDPFPPSLPFNHLVRFAGAASACTIIGNDAITCAVGTADTAALGPADISRIIIKDNLEAHRRLPFTVMTTDTTPTTVQTITLGDEASYVIRTKIQAQQNNSVNQAYYELIGLFKRDAGGGATQVGSTVVVASLETASSYDASFQTSGNDVNIVVTGIARW